MNQGLPQLANFIRQEMDDLDYVIKRANAGLEKAEKESDELYFDGIALNLHGFYSGVERVFERISVHVDGSLPQGASWHQILLLQMAEEVPGIRPAVISEDVRQGLDEYRGFRHVVRNVYAYKFDPIRLSKLTRNVAGLYTQLNKELRAFADFLESSV